MINPDKLLTCYCGIIGVVKSRLIEENRATRLCTLRHYFAWIAFYKFNLNYSQIAKVLGYRDRTTIMHSVDKITTAARIYPEEALELTKLTKRLKAEFILVSSIESAPATICFDDKLYHFVIEKRDKFYAVGYIDIERKPLYKVEDTDISEAIHKLGQLVNIKLPKVA